MLRSIERGAHQSGAFAGGFLGATYATEEAEPLARSRLASPLG
jgi:hypothetical protein